MALLGKLQAKFAWMESMDLRVGTVYLNPKEVAELAKVDPRHFDPARMLALRTTGLRGTLWGAEVYESDLVPENHVCLVQSGLEAKLVAAEACMPLGD